MFTRRSSRANCPKRGLVEADVATTGQRGPVRPVARPVGRNRVLEIYLAVGCRGKQSQTNDFGHCRLRQFDGRRVGAAAHDHVRFWGNQRGPRVVSASVARRPQSVAASFPLFGPAPLGWSNRRPRTSSMGRPPIRARRRRERSRGAARASRGLPAVGPSGAAGRSMPIRPPRKNPPATRIPPSRAADAKLVACQLMCDALPAGCGDDNATIVLGGSCCRHGSSACRNRSMSLSCRAASALPSTWVNSPNTSARTWFAWSTGNSPSTNCDNRISFLPKDSWHLSDPMMIHLFH